VKTKITSDKMKSSVKRIMKEISDMKKDFPDFMQFQHEKSSVDQIFIDFNGPEGTLYAGEHFQLLFEPGQKYPFRAPKMSFVGKNIPVHPCVHSNGQLCKIGEQSGWTSAFTFSKMAMSIMAMLSSCTEKKPAEEEISDDDTVDEITRQFDELTPFILPRRPNVEEASLDRTLRNLRSKYLREHRQLRDQFRNISFPKTILYQSLFESLNDILYQNFEISAESDNSDEAIQSSETGEEALLASTNESTE